MARRLKNPMRSRGAVLITNGRARRSKKSVDIKKIVARLKNRRPARSGKRRNPARGAKGRFIRRRKNGLAVRANRGGHRRRSNRKHRRRSKGKRRRNGLAVRANGKRFFGKRRRNGLAVRANGKRRKGHGKRRRNGLAVRANPMGGVFGKVQSFVKKLPIVGRVAPIAVPAAAAALVVGGVHFALQFGVPMLPAVVQPYVQQYVAPVGYTVGGALIGFLTFLVPKSILSPASKQAIASLAVVGGGAVDGIRYLTGSSGGTALAGYGEGGLWTVGGGADPDGNAVRSMYRDASLFDAGVAPGDFDIVEGEAILAGPRVWATRFPPAIRLTSTRSAGPSRHAGQHGHRWGWLIHEISWAELQSLARSSQPSRVRQIAALKQRAMVAAKSQGAYGALVYAQ